MGQASSRSNRSLPEHQSEESAGTKRPGEDLCTRSLKRRLTDVPWQRTSPLDSSSTDLDNLSLRAQLEESRQEVDQLRLDLRDAKELVSALSLKSNTLNKQNEAKEEEIKRTQQDFWTEVRTNRNDISDESVLSDVGVKGRRADDSIGKPDMTFWEEKSGRKKGGAFRDAALEEIDRRAWYV
jgi:hypothetical protein